MSRRDKIRDILTNRLATLKESSGGHQLYTELIESVTSEVMELSRPSEEIIHVIGPNGNHRLIVDGQSTDWKSQTEIARQDNYCATTDFYMGQLPQVCRITPVDPLQFMTTSAQTLAKTPVKYIKADSTRVKTD